MVEGGVTSRGEIVEDVALLSARQRLDLPQQLFNELRRAPDRPRTWVTAASLVAPRLLTNSRGSLGGCWIHQCWFLGGPLQCTNNMRRYTAHSPISKRYMYTPLATARPCWSRPSQVRRCSPACHVSAASTRTRWPVRL